MYRIALLVAVAVGQAVAICPGFNYAIGNVIPLGGGVNRCTSPFHNKSLSFHERFPRECLRRFLQYRRWPHHQPKPVQ